MQFNPVLMCVNDKRSKTGGLYVLILWLRCSKATRGQASKRIYIEVFEYA